MNVSIQKIVLCVVFLSPLALSGPILGQTDSEQLSEEARIAALRTPTLVTMDVAAKDDCGTLVLSFGDREDAPFWLESFEVPRDKAGNLREVKSAIRGPEPSLDELAALFSHSPNRLFIGGHSDGKKLYNRRWSVDALRISIEFQDGGVLLSRGTEQRFLAKGREFLLHQNLEEVYWGGCKMHHDPEQVRAFTHLLAKDDRTQPIMFGWTNTSGWQVTHVIFGGFGNEDPFPKLDYFDRLALKEDPITAWLNTIRETQWGPDSKVPSSASVIDSSGIEYVLSGEGQIVQSGRVFSAATSIEQTEAVATTTATSE